MTMQNDQNHGPGFLESAWETVSLWLWRLSRWCLSRWCYIFYEMPGETANERAAIVHCVARCWLVERTSCYWTLQFRQSKSGAGCAF